MKFLLSVSQLNTVRLLWKSTEMYGITLKLQKFGYAAFQNHLLALGKLLEKECSWCCPSLAARLKSFLPSPGTRPVHLMLRSINGIDFSGDSFIRINNNRGAPRPAPRSWRIHPSLSALNPGHPAGVRAPGC